MVIKVEVFKDDYETWDCTVNTTASVGLLWNTWMYNRVGIRNERKEKFVLCARFGFQMGNWVSTLRLGARQPNAIPTHNPNQCRDSVFRGLRLGIYHRDYPAYPLLKLQP